MAAKQHKGVEEGGIKPIAVNRKARHEYIFEEFFEAGIELRGTEVKSLRIGRVSLVESYASVDTAGQVWLKGLNISRWEQASCFNHDPLRARRLLLHKHEIRRLNQRTHEKGLTLVPVRIYFKRGLIKVELALARGKKLYDKREAETAKAVKRDMERAMSERGR